MGGIRMFLEVIFQLSDNLIFCGFAIYGHDITCAHESEACRVCMAFDEPGKHGFPMKVNDSRISLFVLCHVPVFTDA